VVHLLDVVRGYARAYGLHALAVPGQKQTQDVQRCPLPSPLVAERVQERSEPPIETLAPIGREFHPSP
jgi:hypothetical protein